MKQRTTYADTNKKLDIIEHLQQEHMTELLMMAQFYSGEQNIDVANIVDIYNEGVLIDIVSQEKTKALFIEFELIGELEENILYLAYNAAVRQKKSVGFNQKNFFRIISKQQISGNFIRLLVQSQSPLPEYYAEYAYGFHLKVIEKSTVIPAAEKRKQPDQKGFFAYLFDRGFLWLMKRLSGNKRKRMIQRLNKNIRLYTLRKSCKASPSSPYLDQGFIDIFTHNNSPGSQWADSLKQGDVILSGNEIAYKHDYLMRGNVVLIADEAAYPAVAGILEHWTNTSAPSVIIVSTNNESQAYFTAGLFPDNSTIHRIVCAVAEQAAKVIEVLKAFQCIDAVWGALEDDAAKSIRYYLRNQRGLGGKQSYLKGYWKLK